METLADNVVVFPEVGRMGKKSQVSFFLPDEMQEAIRPLIQRFGGPGGKRKWVVYVAGLVKALELSEAEISELIGEVSAADATGRYAELLTAVAMRRARRTGEIVREPNGVMTDGYGAAIPPLPPGRESRVKGRSGSNRLRSEGEGELPGRKPGRSGPRRK